MDPHSLYADPDPAVFLNADPDPDPDPGGKMNADPCGSGSTALLEPLELKLQNGAQIKEKFGQALRTTI